MLLSLLLAQGGLGVPPCCVGNFMANPLYVVVGGSSSLGVIVSSGLHDCDRRVLCSYNQNPVEFPPGVKSLRCDVENYDDCLQLAALCSSLSKELYVVYLPGISKSSMTHKTTPSDWEKVIKTNLTGAFHITRAFLPAMRESGYGRFVYAGSVTGRLGSIGTVAYSASKEGLKGLMRVVASENAAKGITANLLEIGYMSTGLTDSIPNQVMERILTGIPEGKLGDPQELASILIMLEATSYVTGSVIAVSGGL